MTIEEKLKDLILSRYNSVREFTLIIDMPYTTLDSIFRRGVGTSSVANIIKICKELGISADALAEGEIVAASEFLHPQVSPSHEIREILAQTKIRLIYQDGLTLEGEPIDRKMLTEIAQGIDVSYETIRKYAFERNKNRNKNDNKN